jgi:transposase
MRQKSETQVQSSEQVVKDIRRATRNQYSAEEKIKIVLDGLRGEYSIAAKCATSRNWWLIVPSKPVCLKKA